MEKMDDNIILLSLITTISAISIFKDLSDILVIDY